VVELSVLALMARGVVFGWVAGQARHYADLSSRARGGLIANARSCARVLVWAWERWGGSVGGFRAARSLDSLRYF